LKDEILESNREVSKVTNYILHEAFLKSLEFTEDSVSTEQQWQVALQFAVNIHKCFKHVLCNIIYVTDGDVFISDIILIFTASKRAHIPW